MKKVVSLLLAVVLVLGLSVTAFAANPAIDKDKDMVDTLGSSRVTAGGIDSLDHNGDVVNTGTINPQGKPEIKIALTKSMFTWKDPDATSNTDVGLTKKDLSTGKVTVKSSVKAGSKVIDEIKFDGNTNTVIKVKFVERFVSTKDQDFDVTIYLWIDGKRQDDRAINIIGTYENRVISVDENDDYFNGEDGAVAEATEFVKAIDFDLGKGITIETKMFKDKKYYGVADRDADAADDVVFAKYPDIDNVVSLYTVGLNQTGDKVKFDTDFSGYYVYDKDLKYLGLGTDKVAYSSKYYLANKKLDVVAGDATDEEPGDDAPDTGTNPITGGDTAPANINDNPGTGR